MTEKKIDTELEAAAFRKLIAHLAKRNDVQNIDLMNLAGFCRNCLSRWYAEAALERGIDLAKDDARQRIYGMEYADWKRQYQTETTPEQVRAFEQVMADPDATS